MKLKKDILGKIQFFWISVKKFYSDHGFFLSTGIAFNLIICLIPFILLLLSFVGTYLYTDREVLRQISHFLENAFPSLDPRIMKNILRIVHDRKIVGILGIGGLIWTSTWFFSSLRTAINIVFNTDRNRSVLRGKAIDLLMIILAIIFFLASMFLSSAITFIQGYRLKILFEIGAILKFVLRYFIPFFFTFFMAFLIYKVIPNRKIHFCVALRSALFTSIMWEIAKHIFGWYILHLGRFSMIYGSLSTLIIFFLWVYYSSIILILGGEVTYFMESRKAV